MSEIVTALEVRLNEEQIRERNPWECEGVTEECRKRYTDFKAVRKYHDIRSQLLKEKRFCEMRFLDPANIKSSKKPLFNPNILQELDKHYTRKGN